MSLPNLTVARQVCPHCRSIFRAGFARCPADGNELQQLADDPLVGSTFAGRFVVEACIGEGGMGRVYRAAHKHMSRRFAIKVLFGDLAADSRMQHRFANEAEAASRMAHRNLVAVQDFGETEEKLIFLVMDYVEGPSLKSIIDIHAPLETDRAANLLWQLAAGLGHAHQNGLVHRDFKPDNVIVATDEYGEAPKILDFGIARILDSEQSKVFTTEGTVMGTPAYMSPEQATAVELDGRTDLFSLGVVLYEMLAGVLPFEGSPLEVVQRNIAVTPPRINERVPGLIVDSYLEDIAFRLMAKKPEDRYQSTSEVIAAIAEHSSLESDVRQRAKLAIPRDWSPTDRTKLTALPDDSEPAVLHKADTSATPALPMAATEQVSAQSGEDTLYVPPLSDNARTATRSRRRRRRLLVWGTGLVVLVVAGISASFLSDISDDPRIEHGMKMPELPRAVEQPEPPVADTSSDTGVANQADALDPEARPAETIAKPAKLSSDKRRKRSQRKAERRSTKTQESATRTERPPAATEPRAITSSDFRKLDRSVRKQVSAFRSEHQQNAIGKKLENELTRINRSPGRTADDLEESYRLLEGIRRRLQTEKRKLKNTDQ